MEEIDVEINNTEISKSKEGLVNNNQNPYLGKSVPLNVSQINNFDSVHVEKETHSRLTSKETHSKLNTNATATNNELTNDSSKNVIPISATTEIQSVHVHMSGI